MRLLPWWWVLRGAWLGEGIWIIYLIEQRGLTLGQVIIFDAVFSAIVLAGEVPTGMIADRYGRRISLLLSSVLLTGGYIIFGLATSIPALLASYAIFAIAAALMSGADSALLFDTMQRLGRNDAFARVIGRLGAVQLMTIAALTVAGGLLAGATSLATPIVLSGVLTAPAIVLAWLLVEPPHEGQRSSFLGTGSRALLRVTARRSMWGMILLFTVVGVSMTIMGLTLQPVVVSYGVPLWTLGLFAGSQMLVAAAGSWSAGAVGQRLRLPRTLFTMLLISTFALLGGASELIWLFPVFVLPAIGWGVAWPHVTDYLSRRTPNTERATVLSIMNMTMSAAAIVTSLIMASVIDRAGLGATLAAASVVLTLLGLLTYALWVTAGDTDVEPREAVTDSEPRGATTTDPALDEATER